MVLEHLCTRFFPSCVKTLEERYMYISLRTYPSCLWIGISLYICREELEGRKLEMGLTFLHFLWGFWEGLTRGSHALCWLGRSQAAGRHADPLSGQAFQFCMVFLICLLLSGKAEVFPFSVIILLCYWKETRQIRNFWTLKPQVADYSWVHSKTLWQQCLC